MRFKVGLEPLTARYKTRVLLSLWKTENRGIG